MTRLKSLFAAAVASAIIAVVPATAQTVHVAGAGSSAQFDSSFIGADTLALGLPNVGVPTYSSNSTNCNTNGDALAVYHYSSKNSSYVVDTRSANINPEEGNTWVVWTAACSDATGATNVTDIWLDSSVDSTVGVRAVLAQETSGSGAQIGIVSPPPAAGNIVKPASLFPDNAADIALPAAVYNVIGTGITAATAGSDVHVNVGLTDIRPEDALFATIRTLASGSTTTYAGLGYRLISTNANFGTSILTGQNTGTKATPELFALSGGTDPVSGETVPATVVTPIGAAPIIFGYNHGAANTTYPLDLNSGVVGNGSAGGPYNLAHLFDGTTACDTTNAAFTSYSGPTLTVNPVLREALSGTMNTTEYSLFRTTGNTDDSQEKGTLTANGYGHEVNPVQGLACASGAGARYRAIGTGEVTGAIDGAYTPDATFALGYFFYSFPNASKFGGGAAFNYFTLDGVDPIGLPANLTGNGAQTFPNCPVAPATNCPASLWANNLSYPTLRNGSYGAWSIYRWVSYSSNTDPVGPVALANAAQNAVDTTIADYVPFYTATGGIGGVSDGLSVYHSHFTQEKVTAKNGTATAKNATNGGNTLGGTTEAGGDEGGVIEGGPEGLVPDNGFGAVLNYAGTVTVTLTGSAPFKVQRTAGQDFIAGTQWEGCTINFTGGSAGGVNGSSTVSSAHVPTATILYVVSNTGGTAASHTGVSYTATCPSALAVAPGTISKRR